MEIHFENRLHRHVSFVIHLVSSFSRRAHAVRVPHMYTSFHVGPVKAKLVIPINLPFPFVLPTITLPFSLTMSHPTPPWRQSPAAEVLPKLN